MKPMIKTWLREPLVHFLVAGLAVFLFAAWRGDSVDPASRTIAIDEQQVSRLAESWSQTWNRPPTSTEIDGLIRDYIKEEVYYREAKRMGLDADDAVIRRRLRSKMEFLATSAADAEPTDDAKLQGWLDKHAAKYALDPKISYNQIYLGENADAAATIQSRLSAGADWHMLGTLISLPKEAERASRNDIARDFGDDFASALAAMKSGGWSGPVQSGYGWHFVRILAVTPGAPAKLADVRQQVENDWRAAMVKEREAKAYQALLDGYQVRIEKP